MRYVLTIAYDGTEFCGWQVQNNGRSVQAEIENAVFAAFKVRARVTASGRTDSGVHAEGQVAHVDLPLEMPGDRVADALNPHLPASISVLSSKVAREGFDANRSAKRKTYCYKMYFSRRRNPLLDRFFYRAEGEKNVEKMREAASLFVGEHDFSAYCASGSQVKTTVRKIYSFSVTEEENAVRLEICGNGFLYNMVRTLAGTVLGYSQGKINAEKIIRSLKSGDRSLVGKTLPPQGLVLKSVEYE